MISNVLKENDTMTTTTTKQEITYYQVSRTYSSTASTLKDFFYEQYEVSGQ